MILLDDYSKIFKESMVIIEHNINLININKAINEIYCIESNTIDGLSYINEGIIDTIKNSTLKIWNAIVKMWNKFSDKVEELTGQEKKFLTDNKGVILKKKPIQAEIEIYDYNLNAVADLSVPRYDHQSLTNIKDKDDILNKILGKYASKRGDGDNTSVIVKNILRGSEPKSRLSTELNFAEMYNFCYSFKELKDKIRKDITEMENTKKSVLTISDVKAKQLKEDNYFSVLFNDYITEVKINTNTNNNASSQNNKSSASSDKMIGNNVKNINGDEPTENEVDNTVKTSDNKGDDYQQLVEKIKLYYNTCGDVLAAKLNVVMSQYKDYMGILRWHVNNFTSAEKKDKDRDQAQSTTDYSEEVPK